jgi:hypothetical protein
MEKITVSAVAEAAIEMAKTHPFPEALRPELARQIGHVMQPGTEIRVKAGKQSVKTLGASVLNAAISEFDDGYFRAALDVVRRTRDTREIEEAYRKARPYPGDGMTPIDLDHAIDIANKGI